MTVAGLLSASLALGQICETCAITHGLVLSYAVVCFAQRARFAFSLRGVSLASASVALAYVLLAIPGLSTPLSPAAESARVFRQLTQNAADRAVDATDQHAYQDDVDQRLEDIFRQLTAPQRQILADGLDEYRNAPVLPLREPRALLGSQRAPVRITEFTDSLCQHCGTFHGTLTRLRSSVPARAFSIEPRQFPLDSSCNPAIEGEAQEPIRCVAARAQICLEDEPDAFEFIGTLFRSASALDEELIYRLAEPLVSREALAACLQAPETEAALQRDIALGVEYGIEGTPLVLLNGRSVRPFGPLLYSLIVNGGDPHHWIFETLPPPSEAQPASPVEPAAGSSNEKAG